MFKTTPFIRELEVFRAAYREGSVSKASAALSMDQGNLSRLLQRLEEKLGTKLFMRHRGGIKPTFAAIGLHTTLEEMGSTWQKLERGGFSGHQSRTIKLGMHSSLAHTYLGKMVSHLGEVHPDIYLDVRFDTSLEITRRVQQRKLDIGVVVNPIKSRDLIIKRFATERIVLCAQGGVSAEAVLLRNPQMLFMEKLIKHTKFKRVIDLSDYDVAASICEGDKRFCCIVPSTVKDRHTRLKTISELKGEIPVRLITFPGSSVVGLLTPLAKACSS
jgi:LysR family transcriptional regulator, cell division regulator